MSASQDKKKRQSEREAGLDRRQILARQEEEKKRKEKVKWTVGTILVVLLIALIIVADSNLFYSGTPAVTIGNTSYTNAEYEYYYKSAYYEFSNTYSTYLSLLLDTSEPLDEQTCAFDSTKTWAEYFRESALTNMEQITALYEAGVAAGYTLSDEDAASIDSEIENFSTYADSYGYTSAGKYIAAVYGRGVTEKTVRKLLEMNAIASDYAQDQYKSYTYTQDDLDTWYAENKDSYDTFDYLFYYVAAEKVEVPAEDTSDGTDAEAASDTDVSPTPTDDAEATTTTEVTDETMADAKAVADAIAEGVTDAESFRTAVAAAVTDATPTENADTAGSSISSVYADWMKDASRKAGDVTVAESEGAGYYVVLFLSRDDNTYNTVSARHILIKAVDSDGDGTYSDEEKATAKDSIEAIYNEWKNGDATEDSFATLAEEKSEDTGSNTNGGLYEDIYKGEMVDEFNDFCFDPARQPGDTAVVYGETSSYTGYHLVYYVGTGERYCDYLADANLRSTDYSDWQTALQENYTASTKFVFRFADE